MIFHSAACVLIWKDDQNESQVTDRLPCQYPVTYPAKNFVTWTSPALSICNLTLQDSTRRFSDVENTNLSEFELIDVSKGVTWRGLTPRSKKHSNMIFAGRGFYEVLLYGELENESNSVVDALRGGHVAGSDFRDKKNIKTEFSPGNATNRSFRVWASEMKIIQP